VTKRRDYLGRRKVRAKQSRGATRDKWMNIKTGDVPKYVRPFCSTGKLEITCFVVCARDVPIRTPWTCANVFSEGGRGEKTRGAIIKSDKTLRRKDKGEEGRNEIPPRGKFTPTTSGLALKRATRHPPLSPNTVLCRMWKEHRGMWKQKE